MFKRIAVILLLCNFINTVLFTTETVDLTPNNGQEEVVEEINSLVEFVVQDCMDIPDDTPEDEDDDMADPFQAEKTIDLQSISIFEFRIPSIFGHISHCSTFTSSHYSCSLEILSPPPKLA
jgi:hypothetical protein